MLFVVDVSKEYIAVREANRLTIPVIAMVDTNSDPSNVDFPIPANDDASKSISLIIDIMAKAIEEGLSERKMEKEKEASDKKNKPFEKKEKQEVSHRKLRAKKSRPEASEKNLPKTVNNEVKGETKRDEKVNAIDSESKKELPKTDSENHK